MRQTKIGTSGMVEFYDSIEDLPIELYNKLQQYTLLDLHIGNTLDDVVSHYERLDTFMSAEKWPEAVQERHNLQLNLYSMMEGINYGSYSLACMVSRVNGEVVKDYTEDGVKKLATILEGFAPTEKELREILDELKKKLMLNLLPSSLLSLENTPVNTTF